MQGLNRKPGTEGRGLLKLDERGKYLEDIDYYDLGTLSYEKSMDFQNEMHEKCCRCEIGGCLIVVEHHPPIITMGKNTKSGQILVSPEILKRDGIEIIETDRGGQITAHMPGQLVAYPILPVSKLNLTPRRYIHQLELTILDLIALFNIKAQIRDAYPGVWIDENKICAIGVRIKERVSLHGLALNVNNDLSLFNRIIPCGLPGFGVTSITQVCGYNIEVAYVKEEFKKLFQDRFNVVLKY
ncbi:MAG: lipoyl(octanoyl) transferase LipB [Oligoflexales bacterium]|nr:lipoyl(octanoyl) transferase LipB [Oligoflexales bacterium]